MQLTTSAPPIDRAPAASVAQTMAPRPRLRLAGIALASNPTISSSIVLSSRRFFSSSPSPLLSATTSIPPPPPQRWVSDIQSRIGRCLSFGCSAAQVSRASGVLTIVAKEWRELLAGSEGFLSQGRAATSRKVVWGEMDTFVGSPFAPARHLENMGEPGFHRVCVANGGMVLFRGMSTTLITSGTPSLRGLTG